MPFFKRNAKDSGALNPARPEPAARGASPLAPLLPGLAAALAGLLAAAAVLWFGLQSQQREQQQQVAMAWGQSQASALDQALRQLAADTQTAAASPVVLE